MNVLVINSGSSSIKFQLINVEKNETLHKGHIDGIGSKNCLLLMDGKSVIESISTYEKAIDKLFSFIKLEEVDAIGHRVVHGGCKFSKAVLIDKKVISAIQEFSDLAPLHNPVNLLGINACIKKVPKIPQVAVFDTSFHQTIPKKAYSYAIPQKLSKKYKIRKYGFHGTSHSYLYSKTTKLLNKKVASIITCHLGNGASITAIKNGEVVDTSMGFTPLQGLVMGTRCGDIDSEIIPYLMKKEKKSISEIMIMLNKESGLKGMTGFSDMRDIFKNSNKGNQNCIDAIETYSYKIALYISGYIGILGKYPDAIVFSAGTGQGAYYVREKVCETIKHLGILIDKKINQTPFIDKDTLISKKDSKIKVYVIPTNEEYMIAKETKEILRS